MIKINTQSKMTTAALTSIVAMTLAFGCSKKKETVEVDKPETKDRLTQLEKENADLKNQITSLQSSKANEPQPTATDNRPMSCFF